MPHNKDHHSATNLSQLKRVIQTHPQFEIIGHCRKDCIGEIRQVHSSNTQGFYSAAVDLPPEELAKINGGQGLVLWWDKAANWQFDNGVCSVYDGTTHTEDHLIMSFRILEKEAA